MSNFRSAPVVRVGAGCLAALVLGAFAAAAQNPPLAEVARREEERRKVTKPATKVLTNKDLPRVTSPPKPVEAMPPDAAATPPDPASAPAGTAKPAVAAAAEPGKTDKDETWWRARITEARASLRRDEVLVDALQSRVNGLQSDFVGRDDPAQRARIAEDRVKALAELQRVRLEISDLKQSIDDIEEEARKADVPPGWLR